MRFGVALVSAISTLLVVPLASPAGATINCAPAHCYSVMQTSATITGVYGEWHRNNIYLVNGANNQAISSEQWMRLNNGAYLEVGLFNAYESSNWTGTCNCRAYAQFWSDTTTSGVQYVHVIANISPTGANDSYQISRAPQVNQWYIFVNGNNVGLSTVTDEFTGNQAFIGGELSTTTDSSPTSHADNFDMQARVIDTGGHIVSYPNRSYRVDESPPFQGVSYSANPSEWSWQKQ